MKLFKNQKGFNDVVAMTFIGGIVGAIFITGVFILGEINKQSYMNAPLFLDSDNSIPLEYYQLVSNYCTEATTKLGCKPSCSYGNCLWQAKRSDGGNNDYVFGLANLKGWYIIRNQASMGGDEMECDAFLISEGPEQLISAYKTIIDQGNGFNAMDEEGRIIINLNLDNLSEVEKNIVLNSGSDNPVEMIGFERPPVGKGSDACSTKFHIFEVNEIDED